MSRKKRPTAKPPIEDYDGYADHPRYGRGPRYTDLIPPRNEKTHYSWRGPFVPGTAVLADLTRQAPATLAWTHYWDEARTCVDCGCKFLFFAAEQKYWYEELGFGLNADCVRCVACRKREQGLGKARQRYEELFHREARTEAESVEMAECCVTLIEASLFGKRQTERVRALLNHACGRAKKDTQFRTLMARVVAIETSSPQL